MRCLVGVMPWNMVIGGIGVFYENHLDCIGMNVCQKMSATDFQGKLQFPEGAQVLGLVYSLMLTAMMQAYLRMCVSTIINVQALT